MGAANNAKEEVKCPPPPPFPPPSPPSHLLLRLRGRCQLPRPPPSVKKDLRRGIIINGQKVFFCSPRKKIVLRTMSTLTQGVKPFQEAQETSSDLDTLPFYSTIFFLSFETHQPSSGRKRKANLETNHYHLSGSLLRSSDVNPEVVAKCFLRAERG